MLVGLATLLPLNQEMSACYLKCLLYVVKRFDNKSTRNLFKKLNEIFNTLNMVRESNVSSGKSTRWLFEMSKFCIFFTLVKILAGCSFPSTLSSLVSRIRTRSTFGKDLKVPGQDLVKYNPEKSMYLTLFNPWNSKYRSAKEVYDKSTTLHFLHPIKVAFICKAASASTWPMFTVCRCSGHGRNILKNFELEMLKSLW